MSSLEAQAASIAIDELVLQGDFTIQGWVWFEPGDPIGNADGLVAGDAFDLNFYAGRFRMFTTEATPRDVVIAATPATTGQWAHYAVVRENGQARIYIDGQLDATGNTWNGDVAIDHVATGFAGVASGTGLTGRIDELMIWNTARSAAEIQADMTGTTAPDSAGLERYYKIEGTEAVLEDATGASAPIVLPAGITINPEGAPVQDPAPSGPIAITNPGFEAQALGNGAAVQTIQGWDILSGQGSSGVWNPTAAFITDEAPEGQNVAYIDNGGAISQTLTDTFQAGRSYQMTVAISNESPAGENLDWEIRLYAGDTLLGSTSAASISAPNGAFVDATLTLDATDLAGASAAFGQPLRIELFDAVNGPENNAHFDNVRLNYVTADTYPGGGGGNGGGSGSGEFVDTQVANGFFLPTDLAFLPDGRMLVIEKGGAVKIIADPTQPGDTGEEYLNLSAQTLNDAERGLLAVEVDPNFEDNGYIYFYYTKIEGANAYTTVSRFVHSENDGGETSRAALSSETVLWQEHDPTSACCHQGGGLSIAYEPIDANDPSPYKLYIVTSDEFEPQNAQDLTHDDGKVHRVNLTDGSIPTDNPYYDAAVAANYTPSVDTSSAVSTSAANTAIDPEGIITTIHSHGLRNGWRSSYDQESGTLFIGEVGGNNNNTSREDIHIAVAGADYGWPGSEGFLPDPNDPGNPIFSYPHLNGPGQGGQILPGANGASLTGGVVYRGDGFPDTYDGAYFYGDWVRNWIRYLEIDYSGDTPVLVSDNFFKNATGQVLAFEQGPDGALYYITTFQTGNVFTFQGAVNRLSFDDGNQAPEGAGIVLDPGEETGAAAPYTVTFEADVTDPDGDALSYLWSFGDGDDLDGDGIGDTAISTEANPSYTYQAEGQYTVELVVTDANGAATVFDSRVITVGNAPDPTITLPTNGGTYRAGETITLQGFANDIEDGLLDANDSLTWSTTYFLGTVQRPGPVDGVSDTADGVSFVTPDSGNLESALDGITVFLTATDSSGLSTTESIQLTAEKALLSFDAPTDDLPFVFDGRGESGDFTFNSIINFNHTVEAPQNYVAGGQIFEFSHWEDDPSNTNPVRDITTPETGASFRPIYAPATTGPLALALDGSGGVATDTLVLDGDFTIESWVRFTGAPINNADALGGSGTLTDGTDLNFFAGQLRLYQGGVGDHIIADHISQPDVWTHYAVVRENGVLRIYVDGALNKQETGPWNDPFIIDKIGDGTTFADAALQGELDEWRAWSVARSAAEINAAKDAPLSDPETIAGLERYYGFDGGLVDQSGNAAPSDLPAAGALVISTAPLTQPPGNTAPEAADDAVALPFEGAAALDVLANDSDADGDALAITGFTQGSGVTVAQNPDGTLQVSAVAGFSGNDSFSYTISDGNGGTATANVDVQVAGQSGDLTPIFAQPGVSSYDSSNASVDNYAPDPALNISAGTVAFSFIADNPRSQQGLLSKDANGFEGGGNHFAAYVEKGDLKVRFQDGSTSRSFVYEGVEAGREYEFAAVFSAAGVGFYVDGALAGFDAGFVMDWQANNEWLNIGGLGWSSQTGDDALQRPFDGDIMDVEIYDSVLSQAQIAALAATSSAGGPQITPPIAPDPTAAGPDQTELTPRTDRLLANDSDPDGGVPSFVGIAQGPANGTVTDNGDGTLSYAPDADFAGEDSFRITVQGAAGGTADSVVAVSVAAVNDAPVANDDAVTLASGEAVTLNVLANDSDVDGGALLVSGLGAAGSVGLALNDEGTVQITAPEGFAGADSFTYMVTDGAATSTATVAVTVTEGSPPPGATIFGTEGNDKLQGTEGDDVLNSLGGTKDFLNGLGGADVFDFSSIANNGLSETRVIRDFDASEGDLVALGSAEIGTTRLRSNGDLIVTLDTDGDRIIIFDAGVFDESWFI